MIKVKILPDIAYLNECFYLVNDEVVFWKCRPIHHFKNERSMNAWNARYKETKVGSLTRCGYKNFFLDKKNYPLHRLIWKLVTGNDPVGTIDHINRIKTDNRFVNLREATVAQNSYNRISSKVNASGCRGVFACGKNKFKAEITVSGKSIYLGSFEKLKDANFAYKEAAKKFHGCFSFN